MLEEPDDPSRRRASGLHTLAQLALDRPVAAVVLILILAAIYPLEQYAVNRAAYYGNPAAQASAAQAGAQADAMTAEAPTIDLSSDEKPAAPRSNLHGFKSREDFEAYAEHAAIDGGQCDPNKPFLGVGETRTTISIDRVSRELPRCLHPDE